MMEAGRSIVREYVKPEIMSSTETEYLEAIPPVSVPMLTEKSKGGSNNYSEQNLQMFGSGLEGVEGLRGKRDTSYRELQASGTRTRSSDRRIQ